MGRSGVVGLCPGGDRVEDLGTVEAGVLVALPGVQGEALGD